MSTKEKTLICTVLLISYNHAPYFRKAIESVLEQKTKYRYEIHVFDDASTDGTDKLILEYERKYPDIVKAHISKKNLGAQGNIWRAYESVKTKYCIMLETDDYWCDTSKLERQIKALEEHPECSFCGHNTIYLAMNEECREYEEGSKLLTNPVLRHNSVMTYDDFRPIRNGGYIPYVSARLIRTEAIELEKIKYKESFLFDFTGFYYLLMKGDFYYIERSMTVYRRTGEGSCSEKRPLEFLNTFIQNCLDFNLQTNFEIADKIFEDVMLQTDFRLQLDSGYRSRTFNLIADPKKANMVCTTAVGDTLILVGLRRAIEKRYKTSLLFIIKPQYEVIMRLYGIKNYKVVHDMDTINWDTVEDMESFPKTGKLFCAHPIFYAEYRPMYEELRDKRLKVDFLTYFKEFLDLPEDAVFERPTVAPKFSEAGRVRLKGIDLSKTVLFCPEAASVYELPMEIWRKLAYKLQKQGYEILINTQRKYPMDGVKSIYLPIEDTVALAMQCHAVYTLRSGICDIMAQYCDNLTVYYPGHADLFIFSLEKMFGKQTKGIHEELAFLPRLPGAYIQPAPKRHAKVLGVPVPDFVYRFYLRHKSRLQYFKRFVRWTS